MAHICPARTVLAALAFVAFAFPSASAAAPSGAEPAQKPREGETAPPSSLAGPCLKEFEKVDPLPGEDQHSYGCVSKTVGYGRGLYAPKGQVGCLGKYAVRNETAKVNGDFFEYLCANVVDKSAPLPNFSAGPCMYPGFSAAPDPSYAKKSYWCRTSWKSGCPPDTPTLKYSTFAGAFDAADRKFKYRCSFSVVY